MRLTNPVSISNYTSSIGDEIVVFGILQYQWDKILTEISLEQYVATCVQYVPGITHSLLSRKSVPQATSTEHGIHQQRGKKPRSMRHQTSIPQSFEGNITSSPPVFYKQEDRRPPPWLVAFTSQFKKDISGLDRKLMGRVLEKITEITEEPCLAAGDTLKPLSGEKKGFWRARVGDYRLVYFPDLERGNISIHTLAPRGSVYE